MVEMSELCLTVLQEGSRLLDTLLRISCLMPSMDTSTLAQQIWALECVHLSTLTCLADCRRSQVFGGKMRRTSPATPWNQRRIWWSDRHHLRHFQQAQTWLL